MIDWYKKVVFDNYANFSGRASRSEYWYFMLCNFLIIIALLICFGISVALFGGFGMLFIVVYVIYAFGILLPNIGVLVRRLHDVNKSGWFYFVALIPLVGGIWLLVMLFTEGDHGQNDYGADPKQIFDETEEIGKLEP